MSISYKLEWVLSYILQWLQASKKNILQWIKDYNGIILQQLQAGKSIILQWI
jgi:hypothetical protein